MSRCHDNYESNEDCQPISLYAVLIHLTCSLVSSVGLSSVMFVVVFVTSHREALELIERKPRTVHAVSAEVAYLGIEVRE